MFFVGSDAKIDMRPSSLWLKEKTAMWPWKTHLKVLNVARQRCSCLIASRLMWLCRSCAIAVGLLTISNAARLTRILCTGWGEAR